MQMYERTEDGSTARVTEEEALVEGRAAMLDRVTVREFVRKISHDSGGYDITYTDGRHVVLRPVDVEPEPNATDAALREAEARRQDGAHRAVLGLAPGTAYSTLAAEEFKVGYRYWPVRPGYEAAWTIASVEIAPAEYEVYRDGRWVSPQIVTITRGDGDVRQLEVGEQVAIQGPWKTDVDKP